MAASRRPLSLLCALLVVVGVELATTSVASAANTAGDPAVIAKVTNLNKKALEAYSQQDWETAKDLLKQALELCDSSGLEQHPITARTHIHFGAVAIVGFRQREVGIKQFKKALEIQPDIKLTKSIVTPELQDAFEEAALGGDKGGGGGAANAGGDKEGGGDNAGGDNGGGGEPTASSDDDEDHPKPKPKKKKKSSDEDEDNKDKDKGEDEGNGQKGTLFFGLTIGSGAGIASGSGHMDSAHQLSGPGFAVGQLGQVEPQIGFFVNPTTLLSLVGRFQYVSGLNGENACGPNGNQFCNPLTFVGAVLARATFLLQDGPGFRFTVGGQIGGGYIAHAVVFSQSNCASSSGGPFNTQCVDALLGGPFLIGPTAGFFYELGDSVDIIVGLNTEIGAPKFTFNFDFDAGIGFRL
jgi:hypothetical protein